MGTNNFIFIPMAAGSSLWPKWDENKPFALVLLVLSAFFVMFLWVKTDYTLKSSQQIGKPEPFEHSITVEGQARVFGTPDIATVTLGVESKADEVASAQQENTRVMNALNGKVKALGISDEDIQTSNYSVYQNYVWNPDTQTSEPRGWIVSQQITVKVRDTSKLSALLETAGTSGATNISGPNFTVDDMSKLKDEARAGALADAMKKAEELAQKLGVRFERIIGYREWTEGGSPPPYPYYAEGMGGGGAPKIEPGAAELILHSSVTYKLVE